MKTGFNDIDKFFGEIKGGEVIGVETWTHDYYEENNKFRMQLIYNIAKHLNQNKKKSFLLIVNPHQIQGLWFDVASGFMDDTANYKMIETISNFKQFRSLPIRSCFITSEWPYKMFGDDCYLKDVKKQGLKKFVKTELKTLISDNPIEEHAIGAIFFNVEAPFMWPYRKLFKDIAKALNIPIFCSLQHLIFTEQNFFNTTGDKLIKLMGQKDGYEIELYKKNKLNEYKPKVVSYNILHEKTLSDGMFEEINI